MPGTSRARQPGRPESRSAARGLAGRDKGSAASTGSACSSKTLEPSHTLISCGLVHEEAHGSLEFTFGRYSKGSDVDRVMEVLPGIIERLRKLSPLWVG